MSRTPIDPTARMAKQASGLLAALGVAPAEARDDLEATCRELLAQRNHDAEVVGLQYGTLTLRAAAVEAGMLRWDEQAIHAELEQRHPGQVTRIRIHTTR